MTETNKPKVTICPPAEQTVFFQECQFDPGIRRRKSGASNSESTGGSWLGRSRGAEPDAAENTARKRRMREATKALEGHENKEEILKILRSE